MKQGMVSNASSLRKAYWAFHQGGLAGFIKALLPRNRLGDCVWGIWKYTETFHRLPNLLFPKDYNEFVLRLMMSSEAHSKLRETISDKEFVKEYVRQKLGEGFTPRTIAVLRSREEALTYNYPDIRVDFYQLDNSFYVGELTNFPGGATEGFTPESAGLLAAKFFSDPMLDVETLFGVYVEPNQTQRRGQ